MFKYFVTFIAAPFAVHAQQANQTFYAAPYVQITDVHKKVSAEGNDFGYNVMVHPENPFLKEGYFMWVDDQWYEILNAKELFSPYANFETLLSVEDTNKNPIQIKDINDVIYLFPIEALDGYKVSYNDVQILAKNIVKQDLVTYTKPKVVKTPVVETPVVETPVVETPVVETPVVEVPVIEVPVVEVPVVEVTNESQATAPVLITSEDPSSVLLDVIDIVEVVKREEVPFDVNAVHKANDTKAPVTEQVTDTTIHKEIEEVKPVLKISATNTPIIANPENDYEIAVNEGFEGTVTEWVEMIDAKGGKTAFEQAIDKGFVGTESDWMKSLWGRQDDVEIAKRDKTTAIVSEWIQGLQTSNGSSPYEMALKHGFYGTFTEWVESVIGADGEKAYEHAQTKGFTGTYKDWIEEQLNNSNKEVLRKERLSKTQMFVAPNVVLPSGPIDEVVSFDLFEYYNQYYGAPMISSDVTTGTTSLEIKPSDLEYQITWFDKNQIKIIELSKEGVVKYIPLLNNEGIIKMNIRYILK